MILYTQLHLPSPNPDQDINRKKHRELNKSKQKQLVVPIQWNTESVAFCMPG